MNREGTSAAAKKWAESHMPTVRLPRHGFEFTLIVNALECESSLVEAYDAGAAAEREAILREIESRQTDVLDLTEIRQIILARKEAP